MASVPPLLTQRLRHIMWATAWRITDAEWTDPETFHPFCTHSSDDYTLQITILDSKVDLRLQRYCHGIQGAVSSTLWR